VITWKRCRRSFALLQPFEAVILSSATCPSAVVFARAGVIVAQVAVSRPLSVIAAY
jgi:hypothetical protein